MGLFIFALGRVQNNQQHSALFATAQTFGLALINLRLCRIVLHVPFILEIPMPNDFAPGLEPSRNRSRFSQAPQAQYFDHQLEQDACTDHQFIAMLDSYRGSGGLARSQEVVAMFKRHSGSDPTTMVNWIGNKKVICFEWQSTMWLPLFQFNRLDMTLQPGLSLVLAELSAGFEAWELARWFAQPSPWLWNRSPADMLGLDPAAVLTASRAVQLVANG